MGRGHVEGPLLLLLLLLLLQVLQLQLPMPPLPPACTHSYHPPYPSILPALLFHPLTLISAHPHSCLFLLVCACPHSHSFLLVHAHPCSFVLSPVVLTLAHLFVLVPAALSCSLVLFPTTWSLSCSFMLFCMPFQCLVCVCIHVSTSMLHILLTFIQWIINLQKNNWLVFDI